METKQREIIKGLSSFEKLYSLTYFFQHEEKSFPPMIRRGNKEDRLKQYIKEHLEEQYIKAFRDEIDFNLVFLDPPKFVDYLLDITKFLFDNQSFNTYKDFVDEIEKNPRSRYSENFWIRKNQLEKSISLSRVDIDNDSFLLSPSIFNCVISGVVALYKKLLKITKDHLHNAKSKEVLHTSKDITTSQDFEALNLGHISHKMLVLFDLGVIDYLTNKYSILNVDRNTRLSKLLYPYIGKGENEVAELSTMRKVLEGLYTPSLRNNPRTDNAMEKVKFELSKVGIDLKS